MLVLLGLALLSFMGVVAPAEGESCHLPAGTFESKGLEKVSWVCTGKAPACLPMARLLAEFPLTLGTKPPTDFGIYRHCDRSVSDGGPLGLYELTTATPTFESPQVVRGKIGHGISHSLECFRFDDFVDYVPLGTARLDLSAGAVIEARPGKGRFAELHLTEPIHIVPVDITGSGPRAVKLKIAVLGTRHALKIAALANWDTGWGSESIDSRIEKEILWFAIEADDPPRVRQKESASSFGKLTNSLKGSEEVLEPLDGKPVFLSLASALAQYPMETLDYVVLLKESWVPDHEGIERFIDELKRLPIDTQFDIVSTRTITSGPGVFQYIAERRGGRYFESMSPERFEVPGQVLGERVSGKIRKRAQAKARALGIELEPALLVSDRIAVQLDRSGLEAGNLITPEHLSRMQSIFDLALCLSAGADDEIRPGILAATGQVGLPYREGEPLRTLFRTWFADFDLPQESPLSKITFAELVEDLRKPEKKAFLKSLLAKLRRLEMANAYCSIFVPNDLFLGAG